MLIRAGEIFPTPSDTKALSTPAYEIRWCGFVYKSGLPNGAPSLLELSKVSEDAIPQAAAEFKGVYFVAIRSKLSGNTYAFVDASAMFHAYHSSHGLSSSFLELIRMENCTLDDLDSDALVEFFHLGFIYEDRTLFRQIRKIDGSAVLRSTSLGTIQSLSKHLPDISAPPKHSFDSLLRDFATAAKGERMSLDITGGIDSRLLASAFSYFDVPFEMTASGPPDSPDVRLAASVAELLRRPFYVTQHSLERIDWDELFFLSDAMQDITKSSRYTQLLQDRLARGVTLSVNGMGGELYKDTWWLQDFPFYSRRKPNLERLCSYRVLSSPPQHALLAGSYRNISQSYRQSVLNIYSRYIVAGDTNTQTYDRIYFYNRMRGIAGRVHTSNIRIMKMGVPFMEHEPVRLGYNLPRTDRLFNRFHRRTITQYAPAVSRLPTTEGGVTSASGAWAVSLDLGRYALDRYKRFTRKVGLRFGRNFFHSISGSAVISDHPRMHDHLRRTLAERRITELLADYHVLSHAVDPHSLPPRYLGSIFVLGRFFQEFSPSDSPRAERSSAPTAVRLSQ